MKQSKFNSLFVETIINQESKLTDELTFLMSDIKINPKLSPIKAINIYQNDYRERMKESLLYAFPLTVSLLGINKFSNLCMRYMKQCLSHSPNLDDYGKNFSSFVTTDEIKNDFHDIHDLVTIEWKIHELFHASYEVHRPFLENDLLSLSKNLFLYKCPFHILQLFRPNADASTQYIGVVKTEAHYEILELTPNQYILLKSLSATDLLSSWVNKAPVSMTPEEIENLFFLVGKYRLIQKLAL